LKSIFKVGDHTNRYDCPSVHKGIIVDSIILRKDALKDDKDRPAKFEN
jgi:hypothetical protein